MDAPGITLAKKIDKLGMRVMVLFSIFCQPSHCLQCSDTGVIYFDDVRVPAKNLIGEEGRFGGNIPKSNLKICRFGIHLPDASVPGGKVKHQNPSGNISLNFILGWLLLQLL